ncbi:hypothetical protein Bbelb_011200 [Branchiostoma belcheri]|nr:hypothetical protein Bbelb_011200 [Branchiostoma belcheri]
MADVLDRLGFGPRFQSWVGALYCEVSSRVLVNGHLSDSIPIGFWVSRLEMGNVPFVEESWMQRFVKFKDKLKEWEGIQKKGKGRCEITFKTQLAFHKSCPSLTTDDDIEVNTFGAGATISSQLWVSPWSWTITLSVTDLGLGGENITFKYVGQPKVCHKCGGQGHVVAECAAKRPLSSEELLSTIKGVANNKTPGSDGLPKEFYYKFWDLVGLDILEVFNEGLGDGLLAVSQRQGIITLLDKAWDPLDPANKRPISLLNVDYKILAKALANRLKRVISQVVNADQSCGIPGRSITDSVCLLRDIAAYANDKDLPCVLLALDQEKAFDRVDHEFMVGILEKLGFGPVFRSWIATLYNGASSNVLVNGNLSSSIPVERGVRQCQPDQDSTKEKSLVVGARPKATVSAPTVDPKPAQGKEDIVEYVNEEIKMVQNQEIKMVQYADDNTCVLSDQPSIDRTFETIGRFESGGTHLAVDAWLQRFAKFKAKLQSWKDRQLTLFGKTLVVNSIAAATLWYIERFILYRRRCGLRSRKRSISSCGMAKALLKSVKKALDKPQLPVSRFTHYWAGLSPRRIDVESWSNSAPHSLDCPSYYTEIKRLLNSLWPSSPCHCGVDRLDRPLSLEELELAVKGMENSNSPGSDGLSKEFYVKFWKIVGPELLKVYQESLEDGEGKLSSSQREGVIIVEEKGESEEEEERGRGYGKGLDKKGDPLNPVNKCPIPILNVDYKILAKPLANRLKSVARVYRLSKPLQGLEHMGLKIAQAGNVTRIPGPNHYPSIVGPYYTTSNRGGYLFGSSRSRGSGPGPDLYLYLILNTGVSCSFHTERISSLGERRKRLRKLAQPATLPGRGTSAPAPELARREGTVAEKSS